jgi:hypothetical protein
VLPRWLNPWAAQARFRTRRFSPEWDASPVDEGLIVDLFRRGVKTREADGQYEYILENVLCVIAETPVQARTRAKACLDHGSFVEYTIEELDTEEAATIETTSAAKQAIADQTAVHPLIGGEYTPPVPEIHLADSSDDIAGVIRIELSQSQLQRQIARIQEYRRRVYDWGQFSVEFQLDAQTNERMLAILATVAAEDEGTLVASVSLTDNDPEVAVAFVLDRKEVEAMQERVKERHPATGEMARWRYPLAETTLNEFHDNARTAIDTDSPGVVGKSPFAGAAEADAGVEINA